MYKKIRYFFYKLFCQHLVKKNLFRRDKFNDRRVLEQIIFPYILSHHNPKRILDIGREDYQGFYNEFFTGRELWTLDIDPKREEFGNPGHHIADDAANVANHFKENYFDFVLINGVLGWGLDNKKNIENAFRGIYKIMKPGGVLIVGWNNFPDEKIIKPGDIESLKKFQNFKFKPLKCAEFECDNGYHTYNFYIKKTQSSKRKAQNYN